MSQEDFQKRAAQAAGKRIRESRLQSGKPEDALKKIIKGDRSSLARAITLLESNKESDNAWAQDLLQLSLPHSGNSIRLGITGVPGVGKSTFIESFGLQLIEKGHRVAVLAIDPSSQKSKGSIMGDKTRMEKLSSSEQAFIRPSPTGSALGGVARKTRESIIMTEAAGYDVIIVETVGVGQSEIMVHSMVDCFLLLMLSGAGDELQGIKRGIMEMADILAITKADGDNVDKSKIARRSYANALHLFPPAPGGWIPRVLTCSAYENKGIVEVWNTISQFIDHSKIKGLFESRRHRQDLNWFRETVNDTLIASFFKRPEIQQKIKSLEEDIVEGRITPFVAAKKLLDGEG